jgi:hypothetical protein
MPPGESVRMFNGLKNRLTWCLIVSFATASSFATAPTAMLYATGKVSVNGAAIARATSVFDGDQIITQGRSAGTVSLNGSSVLVHSDSSVIFTKSAVVVNFGGAVVKTTQSMGTTSGDVNIATLAPAARYDVVQYNQLVRVTALEGGLKIQQGANSFNLEAGKSIKINCRKCLAVDGTDSTAGGTTGGGGAAVGGKIAVGAAIAAGAIAGGLLARSPSSPTVP